MNRLVRLAAVAAAFVAADCVPAASQTISVSPTKLTVAAPGAETTMIVKAGGTEISVVQVRVMAWTEGTNATLLKPTRDVVASPPAAKLQPRQELTVRIVRLKKRAVRGRECYRVLIDRLPGKEQAGQGVKLQVRHSVPLCFTG